MLSFILRRLAIAIPTLLAVITLSFFMMQAAPGSPFAGGKLSPAVRANINAHYGLDKPVTEQYVRYVSGVLKGDFGPSLKYPGRSVAETIGESFPTSLLIGALALLVGTALGIAIGVAAALSRGGAADHFSSGYVLGGIAVPSFVTGPLLILIFASWLHLVPGGGLADSLSYILPVAILAFPMSAAVARLVRAGMVESLRSGAVRTARARGLPRRTVVFRYALPLALLPLVSFLAPATAGLITGSFVVEQIFGIPGLGRAFVMSAVQRDYTLVMGTVILYSVLIVTLNMLADLLYRWLDPRVKI